MSKLDQVQYSLPLPASAKAGFDVAAVAAWANVLVGTLTNFVGLLAALASLAWCLIRLYEMPTVRTWLKAKGWIK